MSIMSASLADQLCRAKWAFTTRRVPRAAGHQLLAEVCGARAGDLVLARVSTIGQHQRIQLTQGRPANLYPADLVVACVGARYAPDQFEASAEIGSEGCDLVAAGGLVGKARYMHERMSEPSRLVPLGLVADAHGRVLNVEDHALPPVEPGPGVPVIAVLGSSMNSGKTTTAASLVHGLVLGGWRVGAAKVTGTGACADVNAYHDAGASLVLDFTDAGLASTYQVPPARIEAAIATLVGHLEAGGCNVLVIEVADGVYQTETAALMTSPAFRAIVDGVVFAAFDALGAVAGVGEILRARLPVVGVSGLVTRSPLACLEAGRTLDLPFISRDELCDPEVAAGIVDGVGPARVPRRASATGAAVELVA